MLRIQVLHQHKAHARIERQMFQQLRERLQPARGCADAHDGKWGGRGLFLGTRRRRREPALIGSRWLRRDGGTSRFFNQSLVTSAITTATRRLLGLHFGCRLNRGVCSRNLLPVLQFHTTSSSARETSFSTWIPNRAITRINKDAPFPRASASELVPKRAVRNDRFVAQ